MLKSLSVESPLTTGSRGVNAEQLLSEASKHLARQPGAVPLPFSFARFPEARPAIKGV